MTDTLKRRISVQRDIATRFDNFEDRTYCGWDVLENAGPHMLAMCGINLTAPYREWQEFAVSAGYITAN